MDLVNIIVYLSSLLTTLHAQDTSKEIFNVEHLQDMICHTNGTGLVRHHGVLVMYETSCKAKLNQFSVSRSGTPSEQYVVYMEHDIARLPQSHWYDLPKEQQLITYFPVIGCPTVYFLRRGSVFNHQPDVWMASSSSKTFSHWVWDKMAISVKVKNNMGNPVLIQAGGGGGVAVDSKVVMANKSITITAHESHLLMAFSLSDIKASGFLCGWVVNDNLKKVRVDGWCGKTHDQWLQEVNTKEMGEQNQMFKWLFAHTYRHTLNLKQALIVPKRTKTGYDKRKIPQKVYDALLEFYMKNRDKKIQKEQWTVSDSIINQDEVKCGMVHLDQGMKDLLEDNIRPILEEWSGLELVRTAVYGIREYHEGNVLKNHVDRLETHVISCIFQIDKDLGGKEDWPLEVIDYNGKRQQVYLESGDMVLYESARLIHGRPTAFKGKRYANVFMHFKPKEGWDYRIEEGKYFRYGDESEPLNPLDTDITKQWKMRDEL